MNIRDLKYLVALKEYKHFGRAAEVCFVSQPALSMQIKKLEETLGVKLLERTNKSVLLTEAGLAIAEKAQSILNQVDEVKDIAKSEKDPLSGEIKIGIFPTLAPYLLPLIIPKLSKAYPKLSMFLVEEETPVLIEKLRQGEIHAAFMAMPVSENGFKQTPLFEEEFYLATPSDHPLAKLKSISQNDLEEVSLLLLDEGHCMRDQALDICHRNHMIENNFRATSLETLRHMVSAGVGVTLMPRLACSHTNTVCYISFKKPRPTRSIALFWRNSTTKEILLNDMVERIKSILSKQDIIKVIN